MTARIRQRVWKVYRNVVADTDIAAPVLEGADARLVGVSGEPRPERLYRRMRFIRRFEESLLELFERGLLNGTTHACIGQEADAVAIVEHLSDDDHVFSNHRCHGHFLARTGDALGLMAEIMGKPEGVCGGIGGSQHLCAPGFKSNGIQGGIVPNAAGIALAKQLDGGGGLSVVFIGDGTLGEGATYETLNLASLWKLPLVVVLEDNEWAQSTPASANLAGSMPRPLCRLRDSGVRDRLDRRRGDRRRRRARAGAGAGTGGTGGDHYPHVPPVPSLEERR